MSDLPPFLGGTKPLTPELVPREELASALTRVTVKNRSSTAVDLEVPGGGFEAQWELIMQDYGIIMSAKLWPADGGASVTLMEPCKFKDSAGLVSGDFTIPAAGRLEVTFDNKYSVLRSKTFDYRIEVKDKGTDAQLQPAPEPEKEHLMPDLGDPDYTATTNEAATVEASTDEDLVPGNGLATETQTATVGGPEDLLPASNGGAKG